MKMYKVISCLCIFGAIGSAQCVQMTPQIQSLLDEKARKIKELEKCDSERKTFVIAGISTLGLTAVGVGGNIALANKNKKLDSELSGKKSELSSKRQELADLQAEQRRARIAELEKACEAKKTSGFLWNGWTCVEIDAIGRPCTSGGRTGTLKEDSAGDINCKKVAPQIELTKCVCDIPKDAPIKLVVENLNNATMLTSVNIDCGGGGVIVSSTGVSLDVAELSDDVQCTISGTGYKTKTMTIAELKKAEGKIQLEPEKIEEIPPVVLNASVDGTAYWYNNFDGADNITNSPESIGNAGDWVVQFPAYAVKGTSACNNNDGQYAGLSTAEQQHVKGQHCWCKIESVAGQPAVSRWGYLSKIEYGNCLLKCAEFCGDYVKDYADFRGAMFGSVNW